MTKIGKIDPSVEHIADADYYPLPKETGMKTNKTLPRIPGRPKLQVAKHKLDQHIARAEHARELFERIEKHQAEFLAAVDARTPAKVHPAGEGTALRDFEPVDPLSEWMDVTEAPGLDLVFLEKQGLVATIKVQGRYYSRPAP